MPAGRWRASLLDRMALFQPLLEGTLEVVDPVEVLGSEQCLGLARALPRERMQRKAGGSKPTLRSSRYRDLCHIRFPARFRNLSL